ncbi:MAG: threonine--tRNA ligase [Candidatus Fraserbacteria bacterium RBG_16_55_9]|uniref:Threonine--tRNA ligase n=1 Tax=Fraserbacteria sp. (strain RBG_16_55_9) TaxID=1817864 RepID=A0A1F5UP99_FRAXR|nr:MAG: threonine--tRNA ligase [Candidatus Fraserbacteria bacterium RBG_16_55_9]
MILKLPDGRRLEVNETWRSAKTLGEALQVLDPKLAKKVIGARRNGEYVDLYFRLPSEDGQLELLALEDEGAQWLYRHSMAHVMAQAVKRLFPEAKLAIGPPIEEGFYYDFDVPEPFKPEDLEKIAQEMQKVVKENHSFERMEVSRQEAMKMIKEMKEPYKLEILNELEEGEQISFYKDGEFVDLCRGPHVPSSGLVKYFQLLEIAGAYWRGDEKNKMLQRIYGTAFAKKEDLEVFLKRREEAARRDHRRLGRELELFSMEEEVGPGLIFWHPKGMTVRRELEKFEVEEHLKRGYQYVATPHLGKAKLWEISGHLSYYRENMFRVEVEGQEYFVKPMNCPFHIMMYKSKTRSYRDLPLKLAEYGTVYRNERSGVLHGLLRVRMITQDDAHIFCAPDQAQGMVAEVVDLAFHILGTLGFKDYEISLSVRDPENLSKYGGTDEDWQKAEAALEAVLKAKGLPYKRMEGEAQFYGPKIDVHVKDAIGRLWQLTTVQLDFVLPERFDCKYAADDGREHRPYIIHRALFGALERFFGILIEHYAGAFPVWLAPVQVAILPIADRHLDYAQSVQEKLKAAGIRSELSYSKHKTLSYRVRDAQLQKIPYMLVMGDKEVESSSVAVRLRTGEDLGPQKPEAFIEELARKVAERR